MSEFLSSLRQQLADRLGSPIFGSFIISWLCWNHRYLLILFSDLPVEYRFTLARTALYPTTWGLWSIALLYPLASSMGYLLLYPHVSKPILVYWDKQQEKLITLRNKAQAKRLLTEEESHQIILDAMEQRAKFQETVQRQQREIDALRTASTKTTPSNGSEKLIEENAVLATELQKAKAELAILKTPRKPQDPLDAFPPALRASFIKMLVEMSKRPNFRIQRGTIKDLLKMSELQDSYFFDKAIATGMIDHAGPPGVFELTPKGRDFLIETPDA